MTVKVSKTHGNDLAFEAAQAAAALAILEDR